MLDDYYWLNEDSRRFLGRDYLEDETPEQRLENIAQAAENKLGKKGFAVKFLTYIKYLPYPCFSDRHRSQAASEPHRSCPL